jgi:hypothetical protein
MTTTTLTCCGTCGRNITYLEGRRDFEMHWYGGHHDCAECNTPRETCSRCKWNAVHYGPDWENGPISGWKPLRPCGDATCDCAPKETA